MLLFSLLFPRRGNAATLSGVQDGFLYQGTSNQGQWINESEQAGSLAIKEISDQNLPSTPGLLPWRQKVNNYLELDTNILGFLAHATDQILLLTHFPPFLLGAVFATPSSFQTCFFFPIFLVGDKPTLQPICQVSL